jgi:hypothetical protein
MYGSGKNIKVKKTKVKRGQAKQTELTQRQKDTLKRHSKHHTKKHMAEMTKMMKQGKTFGEAHKMAMKKVGK